jgi:hypothetical protein
VTQQQQQQPAHAQTGVKTCDFAVRAAAAPPANESGEIYDFL